MPKTASPRRRSNALLGLAAAVTMTATLAALPWSAPAAAQNVSAEVGRPLRDAQKLISQQKYEAALEKVNEADAVGRKSAFDKLTIEQMRAAIYGGLGDYNKAAAALEATVATGQLSPADAKQRSKQVAQLYFQGGDKAKSAQAARRYIDEHGADPDLSIMLASIALDSNDYAAAGAAATQAIEAARKAGAPVQESWLQLVLTAAYRQNDIEATAAALEDLIKEFPKEAYWRDIILLTERTPGFDSALSLDVYRLLAASKVNLTAEERIDMAEIALIKGFPGEAARVLDEGFASGVLGSGADAERQRRLAETAKQRVAADKASLAAQEQEARAGVSGQPLVLLGEAMIGYGDYAKAAELLQLGLSKGGVTDVNAARLHLGVAQYLSGDKDAALQSWASLSDAGGGMGRIARTWSLLARQGGQG